MNFRARSLNMVIANENYLKTLSSLAEDYKSFIIDYYRPKMLSFFLIFDRKNLGSKTGELKILTGVETTQSFGVFVIERTNQNHGVKDTNDLGI